MIDPRTQLGTVRLTVADLDGVRRFYERVVGLRVVGGDGQVVRLGVEGGAALVELVGVPDAPRRMAGTTGLFHLAILLPSRFELARSLRRIVAAGWRLAGASDHLVSEALYLSDPEGNGIEIYRDRPREEWSYADGELRMATLPLDLSDLAAELHGKASESGWIAAEALIGHVHLQVADLAEAESFYAGVLGLEVTVRGYPGALFLAAGGYHHHVGLNVWAGAGAPPPAPGSTGLRCFEIVLRDGGELERIVARAEAGGAPVERREDGVLVPDPSGNGVLLTLAS